MFFAFFSILFVIVSKILRVNKFQDKNIEMFTSCIVGNVNHVMTVVISLYNLSTFPCDFFNDDACLIFPNVNCRRVMFMNIGYHLYDIIIITFVTEETKTLK